MSECSKLAQREYKTRHDWVGKKLKFDHTNNPAFVLENKTQTPMGFWDTNGSPNLAQTTTPNNQQQQKIKLFFYTFYIQWNNDLIDNISYRSFSSLTSYEPGTLFVLNNIIQGRKARFEGNNGHFQYIKNII